MSIYIYTYILRLSCASRLQAAKNVFGKIACKEAQATAASLRFWLNRSMLRLPSNGCKKGFRDPLKGFGADTVQGRFRADPYKNYMAASINWGPFQGAGLVRRVLLLGVFIRAPDIGKLSNGCNTGPCIRGLRVGP